VRWNVLALEDELHEMLGEVGWKPWATSRHFNRQQYLGELVDAFHFLMNLILVARGEEQSTKELGAEFSRLYKQKRIVNMRRQEKGYDGVSEKCSCGRAVEDGAYIEGSNMTQCICGESNPL
jgi:hypothetical protein